MMRDGDGLGGIEIASRMVSDSTEPGPAELARLLRAGRTGYGKSAPSKRTAGLARCIYDRHL